MQENDYQIIVALVNQGYSEEVMAAARPAGAAGGTVLHSRRVGAEEALSQWGFSLQEEKEAVIRRQSYRKSASWLQMVWLKSCCLVRTSIHTERIWKIRLRLPGFWRRSSRSKDWSVSVL